MTKDAMTITVKSIGGTLYIVQNIIGEKAKETAYDKTKKLILNDAENHKTKKVS